MSILNFFLAPLIFSTFWVLVYDSNLDFRSKISRIFSDYCFHCQAMCFPSSTFYIYFAIPFSNLFYGIFGVYYCIKGKEKVRKLSIFRNYSMDGSELPFLTLFEQFSQALPQFVIASFFCISNSDNYFPITYATLILSAGSFVTGLITTFSVGRSIFMKLCDAEFMRIKVYNYDNEFFEGRSPERKLSPIYHQLDILNTQAQQLNPDDEIFETNDVYM